MQRDVKKIAGHWNWHKIAAGFEVAAGEEQTVTQSEKPRAEIIRG